MTGSIVRTIAPVGGTVLVGGTFTSVGGQARGNIAEVEAGTGLVTTWNPGANSSSLNPVVIRVLVPHGETIYAGGDFTSIGGQSRASIAALDATTGLATAWNPDAASYCCGNSFSVTGIELVGGTAYVGGWGFTSIGGQTRHGLAAIDLTTGLATSWSPEPHGLVYALASFGATIYAVGTFDNVAGQPLGSVAGFTDAVLGVPGGDRTSVPAVGSLRLSPNPTAGPLLLEYTLTMQARVSIGLYDLQGREVAHMLDGLRSAGPHAEHWSPAGTALPIGLYVVRVSADGVVLTRRAAMIR